MTDEQLRAAITDIVTDAWDRSRQIDGAVDEIMDAVALAAQHPSQSALPSEIHGLLCEGGTDVSFLAGLASQFPNGPIKSRLIAITERPSQSAGEPVSVVANGIYVASRASIPERPMMWQGLRLKGWPITSTWIDEAGEGETEDMGELWRRIQAEIERSAGVLLYAEADDFPLKGALIECGIALGMGKPVALVLPHVRLEPRSMKPLGSWAAHPLVTRYDTLEEARAALASLPPTDAARVEADRRGDVREALNNLIHAVNWRAAVISTSNDPEKIEFATSNMWEAVDAGKAALAAERKGGT